MNENVVKTIMVVAFVMCLLFVAYCAFRIHRLDVTLRNREAIIDAIYYYTRDALTNQTEIKVGYDDMESFEETDNRLWDWGYTRILPPEKFELVKPYIKE